MKSLESQFEAVSKSTTFKNILETYNLSEKSVLDIGCGYGPFLVHFGEKSTGITISAEQVAYGSDKKIDIRLHNIEDYPDLDGKKFDVIFCNNLFEHLYSPHEFLYKVRKYLNDDGFMILGVPCVPTPSQLMHLKKFRGALACNHINFFTKKTLELTVERGGWSIQNIRGFHFRNQFVDMLLEPIYPHLYIIAHPEKDFQYSEKRKREVAAYTDKT